MKLREDKKGIAAIIDETEELFLQGLNDIYFVSLMQRKKQILYVGIDKCEKACRYYCTPSDLWELVAILNAVKGCRISKQMRAALADFLV